MNDSLRSAVGKRVASKFKALSAREERVLKSFEERQHVSRNINSEFDGKLTFGQRLADKVASFGGSWTFIICFGVVLGIWVLINSIALAHRKPFDPYPYILLNLFLSMLASVQAPLILMSQNRQSAIGKGSAGCGARLRGESKSRVGNSQFARENR